MRTSKLVFSAFATLGLTAPLSAHAVQVLQPISRPYDSVRSNAMGGVRITTGLYDQNFFGNPARVTANPKFRVQLPDPMFETSQSTIGNISDLVGSDGDTLQNISGTAGKNNHLRFQMTFPGVYLPNLGGGKWSYAFAVLTSVQGRASLLNSTNDLDQRVQVDLSPAFTVGRKLLEDDKLAVGLTAHANYRVATTEFSIFDVLGGDGFSLSNSGSEGAQFDFDIGGTYVLPFSPWETEWLAGASINNLLGGNYDNLGLDLSAEIPNDTVPRQPRTYNVGVAVRKAETGAFRKTQVAFEITDIGNSNGGSLFRHLHLGGETHYGVLAPRVGINQGYFGLGLGVDLRFFNLDLAYYGEELGLNSGTRQDRRLALRLDFHI